MTKVERARAKEHINRVKTLEEIFEAGFYAGQDALPRLGSLRQLRPETLDEAFDRFLEDNIR